MREQYQKNLQSGMTADQAYKVFDFKAYTERIQEALDTVKENLKTVSDAQEELDSPEYQQYSKEYPHGRGSGVGYGFCTFVEGLTWHPLFRSNLGGNHALFGTVHGDMIFHLMAAAVVDQQNAVDYTVRASQRQGLVGAMARFSTVVVPPKVRTAIRNRLLKRINRWYRSNDREDWERERALLLEDPQGYLACLRMGAPHEVSGRRFRERAVPSPEQSKPLEESRVG